MTQNANSPYRTDLLLVDVETTGTDPFAGHEPISIGAIRLDGSTLREKGAFESLIRPENPQAADPIAMSIHGLPMEKLLTAPSGPEVLGTMERALLTKNERETSGRVPVRFVAHNPSFDHMMIKLLLHRAGQRLDRYGYQATDTFTLADFAINTLGLPVAGDKLTLDVLAKHFGLSRQDKHDALEDVRITADVLRGLHDYAGRLMRQPTVAHQVSTPDQALDQEYGREPAELIRQARRHSIRNRRR